jgi:hypothetical protein
MLFNINDNVLFNMIFLVFIYILSIRLALLLDRRAILYTKN